MAKIETPVGTELLPSLQDGGGGTRHGWLIYVANGSPEDKGKTHRLDSGSAMIGSGSDCELQLSDKSVSRQHVKLSVQDDGVFVEDMGSTNGTLYLEQQIDKLVIKTGARLDLGRCALDILPMIDSESMPVTTQDHYHELLGSSLVMRKVYSILEMLEESEAPVLIEGETGTGKELVASALHNKSCRAEKPFIIIDCGNVPAELMESELFGHRKGSFTGAISDRSGAFESADGGTIFLDEIGEMPVELQPKLLRVLETGQVKRIGDSVHKAINVRIVAATHRNLMKLIDENKFREDLYYRLAVIRVQLPPLRARREDILILARALADKISKGKPYKMPKAAEEFFMRYEWPGNVRELRNVVHRILTLGMYGLATRPDVPKRVAENAADDADAFGQGDVSGLYREARDRAIRSFEGAYLKDLVTKAKSNISEAARLAGMDRKQLRTLLKKHGLYEQSKGS